jgi:hypothetical protein
MTRPVALVVAAVLLLVVPLPKGDKQHVRQTPFDIKNERLLYDCVAHVAVAHVIEGDDFFVVADYGRPQSWR